MHFLLSLHKNIIDKLTEKVGPNENLADKLSHILHLNKPAIYRRLEGKVAFSFKDMALISQEMRISLDELVGNIPRKSTILTMINHDHLNFEDDNYKLSGIYIDILRSLKNCPDSKVEEVTNLIPRIFYMPYEHITRFLHFKWVYQYGHLEKPIPYKDIEIENKYREFQLVFAAESQTAASTSLILDPLAFYYRINDLRYFMDINLITRNEILLIQQDLYSILDDMECTCRNGVFKNTGKPLDLYISLINFDTNYCYVRTNTICISLIKAFLLNELSTTSLQTYEQIQQWIQSLKRYSTLITQSGEWQRTIYFDYQRRIVESLTNDSINPNEFLFDLDHFKA